ncbi:MAG: hypothetical protein PVG25_02910 [Anaerolineae bacterium]
MSRKWRALDRPSMAQAQVIRRSLQHWHDVPERSGGRGKSRWDARQSGSSS